MNALKELHKLGESIWMDNIRRGMLKSGQLRHYIEEFALTGLTSNPTIFEHAIGGGEEYDEGIRRHLDDEHPDAAAIFFELAIEDLQQAADLFLPFWAKSDGRDGYVSLELAPGLADDTEGSIRQARDLAGRAQRKNLFIKVPGTEAGAGAIEQLIYEGIPVNVTLLFSPDQYRRSAEAYLKGIERRIAEGKDPHVPSVASLFVSRWDKASVDRLPEKLQNKLGVAIGKETYRVHCELYASDRWKKLAGKGASPQRLLWASTGTKDPSLSDDYYVYELVAPDTINTIPEATLFSVAKDGRVGKPLPADGGDAGETLKAINEAGVDTDKLARDLQEDGKKKFDESYAKLLAQIEKKLAELREASEEDRESLGKFEAGIRRQIGEIAKDNVVERIWAHDHTVWKPDPDEIDNRLGWLGSPQEMMEEVPRLKEFVKGVRDAGMTHVLWSGMGGSSLFPQVMQQSFGDAGGLEMIVLDTSNPVTVREAADSLPLEKTLFVFASKSGGTLETRCHLDYFWSRMNDPAHYAVITDKGSDLGKIAAERKFRKTFFNNPNLGGRYSALSHFGLVAAALLGVDVEELLGRAGQMIAASMPDTPAERNPGVRLGAAIAFASQQGCDKLTLVIPPEIASFGSWLEQLIAESTGKDGVGILPVAGETVGKPGVYGDDRFFVCLGDQSDLGLVADSHPVIRLPYVDRYSIGAECFRWEFAIAIAGHVLGINAFDQPNVEAAKKAASKVLAEGVPELPQSAASDALAAIKSGDYLAIQAYVATDSKHFAELQTARLALRDRLRVATTLGLGPRYLHSTGQLHKGGHANGVFVQIVDDTAPDLEIPGRPYGFAQLFEAQAAGDFLALKEHDRRVFRVALHDFLDTANA
ncbi:MAG TPA: bifunctional transaldolase/phosoglucose isomerase [Gammaproteobacteria bacterium]|nr:bifunctional transaldolase/phosoglucose isomerase [Gammaproteobacteria bacterium]